jgi:hypothetical protein
VCKDGKIHIPLLKYLSEPGALVATPIEIKSTVGSTIKFIDRISFPHQDLYVHQFSIFFSGGPTPPQCEIAKLF